ncbi:N-6 DNA methylase [Flavobacterium hibernum]|uniref:N-6 DNA methylase n=1 Tax=Flavobacterium hibernum TaxID=37752 RepID=A0ABX4C256_9FLAO|nr:N-6 DNA methylase [Flavobacterium hibernum]OXA86311.1 N-6 DNA methylase [Flavobacterium hibernum]STO11245.1 Probable type I restriction enzyme BthVORF4518P M protein [Flavobacterium hibernum]
MKLEVQIKDNKIYAPLKDQWLVLKPEEKVRQEYICRLVNNYGFSIEQMAQEVQVTNGQRGQGRAVADVVIWKNEEDKLAGKNAVIVVGCKADHITVHEDDYFQGYNYASWAGAEFFVMTNQKETRIFKVVKGNISRCLEEIVNIPSAKEIKSDKEIEKLLNQTKAFTRDEFSKLLFKCHNIIRNNDKLSPEAAFDEISKILFIKIRYERANSENQIFSEKAFKQEKANSEKDRPKDRKDFYQFLFEQTKEDFKDDDLFEPSEILRIRENSFEAIIKELEIYNLSTTSDDVKGIAFEQFLGRTFRGELGQFFTPRTIVDFMVDVLDPQEGETVCDPCCGSGGFLIKAFEFVRAKIEVEIHLAKEEIKKQYYTEEYEKASEKIKLSIDDKVSDLFSKLNAELDINNSKSRLRVLSYDCIFGTDANPRMSRTAKMNMIMHGDGHGGVHHNDGLLNVNGIFENRFDVILTNPPFGARVEKSLKITEADKYSDTERIEKYKERYGTAYDKALEQVNKNIGKSLLSLYKTGTMSSLTEVLFIERCLNLLKPGGRMGIVLPEGVLNNANLQKIRDFVESKAKIILIISIPQDVFIASGATVKPSLLFFRKFTEEETREYQNITKNVEKKIVTKYKLQLTDLSSKIALKGDKARTADQKELLKAEVKDIEEKMANEIKVSIKESFNYKIPIAQVEKAGISSTGAKIENELQPLAEEFKLYRNDNKLWSTKFTDITYKVIDEIIYRIPIAENIDMLAEPEIFYN